MMMITLEDFLRRYADSDNEWWQLSTGDHRNLFDELLARAEAAEVEVERLRAIAREALAYKSLWHYDIGLEDEYETCIKALELIANSGQDARQEDTMKAQLTIDLTPSQLMDITDFVTKSAKRGEPVFLIAEPNRREGVLKIAMWHGHEAKDAQRILQAALDEAAALDNSGQEGGAL